MILLRYYDNFDTEKIKYPKKIYATVPDELFQRIHRFGISKIDVLITQLLSEYFDRIDYGGHDGNRRRQ